MDELPINNANEPGAPPIATPPVIHTPAGPFKPKRNRGWLAVLIVVLALALGLSMIPISHYLEKLGQRGALRRVEKPHLEEVIIEDHDSANKIAVIPIEGIIASMSYDGLEANMVTLIKDQLSLAADDEEVKAVIIKVDSPGGEVLAADDINRAITEFQQTSSKPVVASMGSLAASGGYYVSVPCRWIVANEMTITGSIGVIMHGYNYRGLLNKVGIRPEVFKSGRFKDMLSGDKADTDIQPEERKMVQALIDETFSRFKQVIVEGRQRAKKLNRGAGRELSSSWEELADGRILSGKQAHEFGFVDELGDFKTAVNRAKKLTGIKNAQLIRYTPVMDISSLLRRFVKTDVQSIKVDIGMDRMHIQAGRLYFLSNLLMP